MTVEPTTESARRSGLAAANRLPMHSLRREPEIPLDGEWQFQLRTGSASSADQEWETATVPGLWTMTSSLDRPHYTNVPMPFEEVYPHVPARNPLGVYRRTVELSPQPSLRTILHVGAAEGHLRVSVNGVPIGSSGDSHLAAEFDITDALVHGANQIELEVAKWSPASYLEDQDQWWQSGIARSVYLYSLPEVRLADLRVVADYDHEGNHGSLEVVASTEGLSHLAETGHRVRFHLLGAEHEVQVAPRLPVLTLPKPSNDRSVKPPQRLPDDFMDLISIAAAAAPTPPEFRAIPDLAAGFGHAARPAGTAELKLDGLEVEPWSAERPHLEALAVELVDAVGNIVDRTEQRIGFRRVRIEGRDLRVNGARILVQGVNRHDVDPRTGRVLTRERMLAELSLLKRFNVNAIRTSHYPNDPVFLDLCDEIGFYVVDEANIETHAFASTLVHDPLYLTEFVERVARMVIRDRNHPCVIAWSLGNESGYGAAHDAAAAWTRSFDPTRPVQYEGAIASDWYAGHAATDVVAPMYASFASLEAYAADARADRPLILCEYAYSQGNATGGLDEYWRLFETLPGLQGGFIWEFLDHALDPDGDGKYRYGGDFGDEPNNGVTLLNGIAFPDLTPKPAMFEMRGIFSPVRIVSDAEAALLGRVRLRNRRSLADLSDLVLEARVETRSGADAAERIPTPQLLPGQEATIGLPPTLLDRLRADDALALSVIVRTARGSLWAPAGTEIAVGQVTLPRRSPARPSSGTAAPVDAAGNIAHPLLVGAPQLSLWRAVTDNDRASSLDGRFVRTGFFALEPTSTVVKPSHDHTMVTTRYRAAFGDPVEHRRRITRVSEDEYLFDEIVVLPEGIRDGLRVGMAFQLVEGFRDASWVGLGPWENYPDRRSSALLGRWTSPIDELAVPYLRPQENGTRGGVDELHLHGPAGEVTVTSPSRLHVNVGRHTVDQLEAADHWWKLQAGCTTVVHLDIAHRGVGTALLGPDVRPAHRLAGDRYAWTWTIALHGRQA